MFAFLPLAAKVFGDCESQYARAPTTRESAECFYQVGLREQLWDEAVELLSRRLASNPENDWLRYYLGNVYWWSDRARAITWYEEAAGGFAARGDVTGELMSRGNARSLLLQEARVSEAELQVRRIREAVQGSGDPELLSRAYILEARHLWETSQDLGRAERLLREAEGLLFPGGHYALQKECLLFQGNVALELGDLEASIAHNRRLAPLARRAEDGNILAAAQHNIANSYRLMLEESPREEGRLEALELARSAIDAATVAGHREVEVMSHRLAGSLLSADEGRREEARGHFERCLELARRYDLRQERSNCLWEYARFSGREDPALARQMATEALSIALDLGDAAYVAFAWRQRMRAAWLQDDSDRALSESMEALAAIERLRDQQYGEEPRAGLFSKWTSDYYFISGNLIRRASDLVIAFQIMERMRARTLVESAGRLEPVELESVRKSLTPTEALLSFQLGLWEDLYGEFGGGAFVTVVTSGGARVVPLPQRTQLESDIDIFLGLMQRRDGSEVAFSERLYDLLLRDAIEALPPSVRGLILIPDDVLHRLPFAALNDRTSGEALASRFELSVVPSGTLWHRWRDRRPASLPPSVIAFASPGPRIASAAPAAYREWHGVHESALGELPYAELEGQSILRSFGGTSELWLDTEASESRLKNTDLREFSVMHFAAHAIVDERDADRSAILLSPDDEQEDGLLRVPEIQALELDGQLVGLSACQTAGGTLLRGEGVLSLARGFFRAGARAVVASLWPLRDDEAAELFESFYARIADGRTVAAALKDAQNEMMQRGSPASAWAGVVAIGDGSITPAPGGIPSSPPSVHVWVAGIVAIFVAGSLAMILHWKRIGRP